MAHLGIEPVKRTADTIQGKKLFKGGTYSRKYGIQYNRGSYLNCQEFISKLLARFKSIVDESCLF